MVVRKGNEGLLHQHPFLHELHVWDKQQSKYLNLMQLARKLRKTKFDAVINLQRFAASGFLTWRLKSADKRGFDKNPFSFSYHRKFTHEIGNGKHEVVRNLELIQDLTDDRITRPKLHPSPADFEAIKSHQTERYVCIAPTSVWFTKQLPAEKWIGLINRLGEQTKVYLLGGPADQEACDSIKRRSFNKNVVNLAGELSFLQSAALMQGAAMNYVNDSAPQHMASATNAPVTAVFCSTIPAFGFGPLSDDSEIVEVETEMDCRPCGLHGFASCPKGHFNCAQLIETDNIRLPNSSVS